jgi:hypothetical protein
MQLILLTVERLGSDRVLVMFDDSGTREYWDGKVGFTPYMDAKKAVIEDREGAVNPGAKPPGSHPQARGVVT